MATLKDYRDERLKKLSELRALGINPYPAKSYRTHKLKEVSENFETLEGEQATVLGRIVSIRKFGKLAFIVLKDDSGKLQLFLRAGDTPSIRGGFTNPHQTSQLVQSKIIHKEKNSSLRG